LDFLSGELFENAFVYGSKAFVIGFIIVGYGEWLKNTFGFFLQNFCDEIFHFEWNRQSVD
jgi:hypothetical protein